MAQMNDPVNGQQSDVISGLLGLVAILVFFAVDGHLVLAGVLGQSFKAWPVGGGYKSLLLETVALLAPFIPFLADEIHRNLVKGEAGESSELPESVHLRDYDF